MSTNVLVMIFAMVSSYAPMSASRNRLVRQHWQQPIHARNSPLRCSFVIVLASLVSALVLAPERPEQLASICERHNSVMACQVW